MTTIEVTIIKQHSHYTAGITLATSALRYAIPIIADGWSGSIQIDPSNPMRGGGYSAQGRIKNGNRTLDVRSVDLRVTDDGYEASIHGMDEGAWTELSAPVSVAIAVVPAPS